LASPRRQRRLPNRLTVTKGGGAFARRTLIA
jgi:hypothetical protein